MADPMGDFFAGIDSAGWRATPNPAGGAFSTPHDMAVFGQTILNRGSYGRARVLSPPAVDAMTRDQVPGIKASFFDTFMEHASWGYGWQVESPSKWPYFHGSLQSLGSLNHPGAGGAILWIDPARDLVGTYFEVTTRMTARFEQLWSFDLFQNVITSAVEDR
jgi:CubicO group peptidase (beta-lactamase class C family)